MNCPHATIAMLVDTRRPLVLAGDASAMYIGIVMDAKPENISFHHLKYLDQHLSFHVPTTLCLVMLVAKILGM